MAMPLSYLELSSSAIQANFASLRSTLPSGTLMAACLKGNAYGHGLREVAQALGGAPDFIQVDGIEELRALRQVSQVPALVLGYLRDDELEEAISLEAVLGIYEPSRFQAVNAAARVLGTTARMHLAIDARLGREGILPADAAEAAAQAARYPNLHLEALYSHFANVEDTDDPSHALLQLKEHAEALERIAPILPSAYSHISSTAGSLVHERNGTAKRLVRIGIGLYGMWPSENVMARNPDVSLTPAIRWVTHVAQVKTLPSGHSVGYGLTYVTDKPTVTALIPQGYSDGYGRDLSNKGAVLIRGTRCPIIGRVAMNMFVVDASQVPGISRDDEAVMLGSQGDERITAEELAVAAGTINYEITTRISPSLPRLLIG